MTTTKPRPTGSSGSADDADATYEPHLTAAEQKWIDKKKYAWIFSILPAAIPLVIWGVAAGRMEQIQAYFFLSIHFCSSAVRWCS